MSKRIFLILLIIYCCHKFPTNIDTDNKIAFEGKNGIYLVDLMGNITKLTSNRLDYLKGWLPDGKGIIYFSERNGKTYLYSLDLTVPKERKLIPFGSKYGVTCLTTSFIFISDSLILYQGYYRGDFNVYNIETDQARELFYVESIGLKRIYNISFHHQDKIIIFTGLDTSRYNEVYAHRPFDFEKEKNYKEIYRINLDMTDFQQLTFNDWCDDDPAISPNGKYIAFASNRDGDFEIYVMDIDGKNIRQLTHSNGDDRHPTWSPDGEMIAYDSRSGFYREIWVMNSDGTNNRPLVQKPGEYCYKPMWSPKKLGGHDGYQRRTKEKDES